MRIVVVVVVVVVVVLVVVAAIIGDGLAEFLDEVGGFPLALVAVAAGPAGPPVGPGRRRALVRFVVFLAALATLLYDDFDGVFPFPFFFFLNIRAVELQTRAIKNRCFFLFFVAVATGIGAVRSDGGGIGPGGTRRDERASFGFCWKVEGLVEGLG